MLDFEPAFSHQAQAFVSGKAEQLPGAFRRFLLNREGGLLMKPRTYAVGPPIPILLDSGPGWI